MLSIESGAKGATIAMGESRSVLRTWGARLLPALVFLVYAITVPGLLRGESSGRIGRTEYSPPPGSGQTCSKRAG